LVFHCIVFDYHQLFSYQHSSKYLLLCSAEERNFYRFGTTWGWVNGRRIVIFGRTIPLRTVYWLVLWKIKKWVYGSGAKMQFWNLYFWKIKQNLSKMYIQLTAVSCWSEYLRQYTNTLVLLFTQIMWDRLWNKNIMSFFFEQLYVMIQKHHGALIIN